MDKYGKISANVKIIGLDEVSSPIINKYNGESSTNDLLYLYKNGNEKLKSNIVKTYLYKTLIPVLYNKARKENKTYYDLDYIFEIIDKSIDMVDFNLSDNDIIVMINEIINSLLYKGNDYKEEIYNKIETYIRG